MATAWWRRAARSAGTALLRASGPVSREDVEGEGVAPPGGEGKRRPAADLGRRALPALLLGAAGVALWPRKAEAVCCSPVVYDPQVEAAVQGVDATLKNVLDKVSAHSALTSQMLDGQGRGSSFGDIAPDINQLLTAFSGAGGSLPSLGVFGGLSRASAGASLPLTVQNGVAPLQGTASQIFSSPSTAGSRARQSFEPQAGADLSTVERIHRRRIAEHRNAAYDGLGLAYHGTTAGQSGSDRVTQLSGGINNAATERAQNAAQGAVQLAILEELQMTNRLLAGLVRIQSAGALRGEDLGPSYQPLPDDA